MRTSFRPHFEDYASTGRRYGQVTGPTPHPAGERLIDTAAAGDFDPLRSHGGLGENLALRWNALPASLSEIDVVVHLHGYSWRPATREMLAGKLEASGAVLAGRSRPTVAIVARGRAGEPDDRGLYPYDFPALLADRGAGLEGLVAFALDWLGANVLGRPPGSPGLMVDRLVLTAHSGGGAPLKQLLAWSQLRQVCDPHVVHVFDALYGDQNLEGVRGWLERRLEAERRGVFGALRIVYRPSTAVVSRQIGGWLPGSGDPLHPRYRAEPSDLGHNEIPRIAGPRLLADPAADISAAPAAAPQRWGRPLRIGSTAARALTNTLCSRNPALRCTGDYLTGGEYDSTSVTSNFTLGQLRSPSGEVRVHADMIRDLELYREELRDPVEVASHYPDVPPGLPDWEGAHDAHRAGDGLVIALGDDRDDIRRRVATAIWGASGATDPSRAGALGFYHLIVYRDGDQALMSVHRPERFHRPKAFAQVGEEKWEHLHNQLAPQDYVLFKRNGGQQYPRQWGHTNTVALFAEVARHYRDTTGVLLGIGDLSHVLGGDITDHASHETGRDVDIYILDFDAGGAPVHYWCFAKSGGGYGYSTARGGAGTVAGSTLETTLKDRTQVACDFLQMIPDVSDVVGHDDDVLAGYDSRFRGDSRTGGTAGWPTHDDHLHVRLSF